jgi:cobyrinic acid a,c-diamide synthase
VQAGERADLESFLDTAADLVTRHVDLKAVVACAAPLPQAPERAPQDPPAQRIALARDVAFAFAYPHLLADWRARGAEILPFSPLADDPVPPADLVLLPGGYPELHAGRLAGAETFMRSLRNASRVSDIYGECGGYMVLGDGLTDAGGRRHAMAGLLRLETSFATRKLHLGYRHLAATTTRLRGTWAGHEFHYATTGRAEGEPLFAARDATGADLPPMGLVSGRVAGSFAHLIARTDAAPFHRSGEALKQGG